jgi:hypothetical protein
MELKFVERMNTKDFLRFGVPLGEATRRATDFVVQFVLRGGDTAKLENEIKPSSSIRRCSLKTH